MAGNGISTVMMKGIFEELVEGYQLPKRLGQELLSSMVERVTQHLQKGDRIRIGGLGTLEVRKREARAGRNPATGETMVSVCRQPRHWCFIATPEWDYCVQSQGSRTSIFWMG